MSLPTINHRVTFAHTGLSAPTLLALAQQRGTRRLVVHRRAYYRAVNREHLGRWRRHWPERRMGSVASCRWLAVRDAARAWAREQAKPRVDAFMAELVALCNKHWVQIAVLEYDGPLEVEPRPPRAIPLTVRTVLGGAG